MDFILILTISLIILLILVFEIFSIYIKKTFSNVDPEIRFTGFFADKTIQFKDLASLKRTNKFISQPIPVRSSKIIKEDMWIKTKSNENLRLAIYKRKEAMPNAVGLLWVHGGGYAMQKPENSYDLIEKFVLAHNTVVVAPDYTLTLDAPFPQALNECYESLLYMKTNAKELEIDDSKIFLGGDSAGGGMTATLAHYARDKGEVNIAFYMPLYPMINPDSKPKDNSKLLIWDHRRNDITWKLYLGDLYEERNTVNYVNLLKSPNYKDLPPVYTFVGTEDPFYEDTVNYMKLLKKAGVTVKYDVYKGGFHAFNTVCPNSKFSIRAWDNLTDAYKFACDNYYKTQI